MSSPLEPTPTAAVSTPVEAELSLEQQAELDAEILAEMRQGRQLAPWVTGLIIFITAAVSLYAAMVLGTERVNVAEDKNYLPSCSAGIYYSCKGVMLSPQAHAFHFANYFYGMAGFGLMMGFGVLLMSGAILPLWLRRAYVIGQGVASIFIVWLIFSVVANIGTMCLWCMLVWSMMAPMLAYLQAWAQQTGTFNFGAFGRFLQGYPWLVTIVLYIAIALTLYAKFGNKLFVF